MTRYANFKMRISEGQKDKVKKAFESNCESMTIRFKFSDLHGEDVIALTISQLDRLVEAYVERKGMTTKMSKTQLAHNMKIEGRFSSVSWIDSIPNRNCFTRIGVGALSGLASTGVQKLIGNGLYLKKGGSLCQIETDGKGLYLGPTSAVKDFKL